MLDLAQIRKLSVEIDGKAFAISGNDDVSAIGSFSEGGHWTYETPGLGYDLGQGGLFPGEINGPVLFYLAEYIDYLALELFYCYRYLGRVEVALELAEQETLELRGSLAGNIDFADQGHCNFSGCADR